MASKFSRLAQLGSLSTRVGGSYLTQRISGIFQDEEGRKKSLDKAHVENAERIVTNLGSLKGAAMKVGQAVAQVADGLNMPPEARAMLGRLHDKAEPVPFIDIRRRVEKELGGDLGSLFKTFDEEPVGTASLGQAHGAVLPDGTQVVVKVLHDGIEDSVGSDMSALKTMLLAGRVLQRDRAEVDEIWAEITARLQEELDYRQEAANLQFFRRLLTQGRPEDRDPDVTIPFVHEGWSTGKVLTMERIAGRPLSVFAATASTAAKQRAGVTLGRTFLKMEYLWRAVHADPHPGNYLFTPEGKVGILDFGCVRRYDVKWMASYAKVGLAAVQGDRETCVSECIPLGCLTERHPEADELLWKLCSSIGEAFRPGGFTMGGPDDHVQDEVTRMMPAIIAQHRLKAPRELVYLHRALGGTHQLMKALKAHTDWRSLFLAYGAQCIRDSERA